MQLNIRVEKDLLSEVDALVKVDSLFGSRSDFIRSAIREKILQEKKNLFNEFAREIAVDLKKRGVTPENAVLLSRKERKKISEESARRKGFI